MPLRRNRVDLMYAQGTVLSGVFAGEPLELPVELPVSAGSASGTFGSRSLRAAWEIASNYNASEQPATLHGHFGDDELTLATTFMLVSADDVTFVTATIAGEFAGEPVSVTIAPGPDSDETFTANGRVGRRSLAITAKPGWYKSTLAGTIDESRVKLTAKRSATDVEDIRIRGQWDGPAPLGLLAITALLYFM